jgi:Fe-S cluster biogenesis protein NfuA
MHGGNVVLVKAEQDTVILKVEGFCRHCPLADLTYNKMIKGYLMESVPEIKNVIFKNLPRSSSKIKNKINYDKSKRVFKK